ncbi:hypothetical protein [Tannerella sp.]|uniref:hypothetical protein n=1 Tax=Tannerella sp. TaxID=2382127 RepID=UPI0026DAA726|nr:hypothetical protein [Tannerella sp.]MDO4702680.1 hypothetical protein [Tannerella sp.]
MMTWFVWTDKNSFAAEQRPKSQTFYVVLRNLYGKAFGIICLREDMMRLNVLF